MSRAGDCPADREEIRARHRVRDGEYKRWTVEGTATCRTLQFGRLRHLSYHQIKKY